MPVTQSTRFFRDQNILEVRGDSESTEILCSARPDVSFVGRLSAGNCMEDATSSTLTRYLLTKKYNNEYGAYLYRLQVLNSQTVNFHLPVERYMNVNL